MTPKEHVNKINEYIGKCIHKGLITSSDLVEIFKHNQEYTCLKKVSKGIHSPQYYYQSNKVVDLFGCKLIAED